MDGVKIHANNLNQILEDWKQKRDSVPFDIEPALAICGT